MSETVNTSERHLGIVKWFGSGGYGFVTNFKTKEDIFVHHTGISSVMDCWKVLYPGEYVYFSLSGIDSDKYKYQAVNVTGVEGGPLRCETLFLLKKERDTYNSQNGRSTRDRSTRRRSSDNNTDADASTTTNETQTEQ